MIAIGFLLELANIVRNLVYPLDLRDGKLTISLWETAMKYKKIRKKSKFVI
jgi:hypothetical protein